MSDVATPEQLAAAIDGKTDEQINQAITEMGVDATLDRIFEGMTQRFLPEKAAGQSALVQWDIRVADGVRTYQVNFADGKCSPSRGANAADPRVTLDLALPDFLRVITGKLAGPQAFFTGKLKLKGDMMFAQVQQQWFKMA